MSRPRGAPALAAALLLAAVLGCVPDRGRADRTRAEYLRVLAAEDARPADGPQRSLLVAMTEHPDPLVRRTAVRALGRLEDPALQEVIIPRLEDPAASVRASAAMALAQSAHGGPGAAALEPLLARAPEEDDPAARGALARAIGRLDLSARDRESALEGILALGRRLGPAREAEAPVQTLSGVALGFEALLRGSDAGVSLAVATRLGELFAYRAERAGDVEAARVRALAMTALGSARRLSLELVRKGLDDPDGEVRRVSVRSLGVVPPSVRPALLGRALEDPADPVAIQAIRFLGGRSRTESRCALLLAAARPARSAAVRVEALEALAVPCPGPGQTALLRETAATFDPGPSGWQAATRALRSLARLDPDGAAGLLPRHAAHSDPFVRAHAARTAALLRERQTLGTLSLDPHPNVRTAAIEGLFELEGHAIDRLLRAHLESDDPWLLLTAAGLLAGSPQPGETAAAALTAFERVSEARRETGRDPRRALLERIAELGQPGTDPGLAERLRPYLADYDPAVAGDVARILESWTGEPHEPEPAPPARAPLPSVDGLDALERTTVTLHLRGLGGVVIRPLPGSALTNAHRFVRLAGRGYFDGLTFHRRVSNFVIQGGSPGANEYAGDGPYTRDEIELPHWRGTVGVSTRGRDTGDGQFFINLVHNPRLDPDYTVFGVVTDGLDVADAVLEGAVIERAEVRVDD